MDFLDYTVNSSEEIIITGDFNFHIDVINYHDGRRFLETIYNRGLEQHVVGATQIVVSLWKLVEKTSLSLMVYPLLRKHQSVIPKAVQN